jgi:predicted DNA-binding transcriptional regulator AlpA
MDDDVQMTLNEACAFLRVCRRTADRLLKQGGDFPRPFRVGNKSFLMRSDLIRWRDDKRVKHKSLHTIKKGNRRDCT